MTAYLHRRFDTLERIRQFILDYGLSAAIPRIALLFNEVVTLMSLMQEHAAGQVDGKNKFRSGAAHRQLLARTLRQTLAELTATARGLNPEEHPGIYERFRDPASNGSYARLLATASAFLDNARRFKSLFTDRAFPADFDTTLAEQIAAFGSVTGTRNSGLHALKAGTSHLAGINRRITLLLNELRPLMIKHLRQTAPSLEVVWRASARTYRGPSRKETAPESETPENVENTNVVQVAPGTSPAAPVSHDLLVGSLHHPPPHSPSKGKRSCGVYDEAHHALHLSWQSTAP